MVTRASDGAADPLSALGYASDVEKHPGMSRGTELCWGRRQEGFRRTPITFRTHPYGWSRDTIDGALLALLAGGFLRATTQRSGGHCKRYLNQQQIGVTDFFSEGVIVSAVQRIEVRKVASAMGLPAKSGEEAEAVPELSWSASRAKRTGCRRGSSSSRTAGHHNNQGASRIGWKPSDCKSG